MRARHKLPASTFTVALMLLTGCSDMPREEPLPYTPPTREVERVRDDATQLSSRIHDVIALEGETGESGAGVTPCGDLDDDTYFTIHRPWKFWGPVPEELEQAMHRLRAELPHHGWKILSFGRNKATQAGSLTLRAEYDRDDKKYAVNIEFFDERDGGAGAGESRLFVDLTSACYKVPQGQTVERY